MLPKNLIYLENFIYLLLLMMLLLLAVEFFKKEVLISSLGDESLCRFSINDDPELFCLNFVVVFPSIKISPIYLPRLSLIAPFLVTTPRELIKSKIVPKT
jgi:hypothetical protein